MTSVLTKDLLAGVFDVTELKKPLSKKVRIYLCSAGTGNYQGLLFMKLSVAMLGVEGAMFISHSDPHTLTPRKFA